MGPEKYTGVFTDIQLRHLLRRTLIGYTKEDYDDFTGLSLDHVINQLLIPVDLPSPPVNNYSIVVNDPDVSPGETWVNAPAAWHTDPENGGAVVDARNDTLMGWLFRQMLVGEPRLHYKLLLFWHNHLANEIGFVGTGKIAYRRFKTMWNFCYLDFKSIMRKITLDPHMLIYLNGTENIKDAPDENYARELQELFCIGKGPNAQFTEADVQEAARVLTGWGVDWDSVTGAGEATSSFYDFQHETRDKHFSGFYNNKTIQGRSGSQGADELDELLDMVVEHPETARFICRKLHRFFISHEITDQAENQFIEPLAELFIDSNYEITPLLRAFFSSDYFFDEKHIGAMIKSPPDVMGNFIRNAEVDYIANSENLEEDYWTHLMIIFAMSDMGYFLGNPPSVSGWPAYYQIPSYDKLWLTTYTLIARIVVTDSFIHDGFWTPMKRIPWDLLDYTAGLENPFDPDELIEDVVKTHLSVPLTQEKRNQLKSILLSGQTTDSYWSGAWADYQSDPTNEMARNTVEIRLRNFYTTFFQLPEYQLI